MASTHKAWRLHTHNDLRFDDVATPGACARWRAMPYVPGTNAIGRVAVVGDTVSNARR